MSTKFTLVALLLVCLTINSSRAVETELITGEIHGKVVDGTSSEPIPYASVALMQAEDQSLVTGVISDESGEYILSKVPAGTYKLKVTFMGYKPATIEDISISRTNRTVEVKPTALEAEITELDEVSVTQERLKGEEKIDRTVFTINDDIRKASTSGIDMLKHIPSVTVDFQDNVTLEGQSNIQFYVDGVLRNKDFVAQLDPQLIDKVELITNPGVKYDADISAVINIVLKKVKRSGVNGSVLVPITHPDRAILNPRANIEYGNQKMRIYAGDRLHYERFRGSEKLYTELDDSFVDPFNYKKTGSGFNSWQFNYMNYGIDLFLGENTSLNLLGEWRSQKGVSDDYHTIHSTFQNDVLTDYHESYQDNLTTDNNHFHSVYFKHTIREGSEISAELNYYTQTGRKENNYTDVYFSPEDTGLELLRTDRFDNTQNLRSTLEFKSDYSFMIKNVKNETGIRLSQRWMSNDFSNTAPDAQSEVLYDNFKYDENWNAAYYNLTGKVKNISWQVGVRGELSAISIQDTLDIDFMTLLPQVSLSRNFEKDQSVKFSFRRQLHKPAIQDLNPFVTWLDSLHVRYGNPELKPALENRMELTYSKNFEANYIAPKIYFRYTQNGIQDLSTITPEGITIISRANIGREMEYGAGISSAIQLFKIWRLSTNLTVFNREVSSNQDLSLDEDDQKVSYRFDASSIVKLPKDFTLITMVYYGSPNINYQREFSRDLLGFVGFEKQFGEKMKLSAFYVPFIKDFTYVQVITRAPGYYENWSGHVSVQHLFSVEFTYNFSYGGKVKKIDRSVEYDQGSGGGRF